MSRLIDADALIPMLKYATTDSEIGIFPIRIGFDAIVKVVNEQPTIKPERKKGKWIDKEGGIATCSVCGDRWGVWPVMNFCPNCGADMRGDDNKAG